MTTQHTTVLIVGAGPAGLTLANLLHRRDIPCILIDKFTREQLLKRTRAGMLEYRTVKTIDQLGLAQRMLTEGHPHTHCEFRFAGERFTLDMPSYYDGRAQHIFPQQEVVRDLLDGFTTAGGDARLGCAATALDNPYTQPIVTLSDGSTIHAQFIAGCDGTYGVARGATPRDTVHEYTMQHEFRWLTLRAAAAPSAETTIYAAHERGFAGHLLRTASVTRFHLQVPFSDTVDDWPDNRIWHELRLRLAAPGFTLNEGPILDKNMLEMHSRVSEPMRYGHVFLVGDAAHIITPAGGKGMNLAIADAVELDRVLHEYTVSDKDESTLDLYSQRRLPDIWKAQEFSYSLLNMIHTYAPDAPDAQFRQKLQQARLFQLRHYEAYARNFSRNYIGPLPSTWDTRPSRMDHIEPAGQPSSN